MVAGSCGNCLFWIKRREELGADGLFGLGSCRRYPPLVFYPSPDSRSITQFPMTREAEWCGKYSPALDQVKARSRDYRIGREVELLLVTAENAARLEADPETSGSDCRDALGRHSARISKELPDMDAEIRARAKAAAKTAAVVDLLVWASLDTGIAEAIAAHSPHAPAREA